MNRLPENIMPPVIDDEEEDDESDVEEEDIDNDVSFLIWLQHISELHRHSFMECMVVEILRRRQSCLSVARLTS